MPFSAPSEEVSTVTLEDKTYSLIQDHYGNYAKLNEESALDKKLHTYNKRVASAFGYSVEDLTSIPENANLGVSCGNPVATANLKPGEKMIDLGSGAGLDVFIAARKVGPTGKVIGIDMTQEMLDLAGKNAAKGGYTNVEFIKSYIQSIPSLSDGAVDVITSNCVINLLPTLEKPKVFAEIFRLLKPAGRVAISDILAKKGFPEEVRKSAAMYVGCVSGASEVVEYETWMKDAGFEDVIILDTNRDLNVYKEGILNTTPSSSCCKSPPEPTITGCCSVTPGGSDTKLESKDKIADYDLNEFVGAFQVYAIKPGKL